MTMATKNEIFHRFLPEYFKAPKARKSAILHSVCETTRLHRKAAIRKFKDLQMRDPWRASPRRGRPRLYTPAVIAVLKFVWNVSSDLCGELLHPVIPEYVSTLHNHPMWRFGTHATHALLAMSEGSVKAYVSTFSKFRKKRTGLSGTKPSALKEIIPISTGPWGDKPPGYGQVDTVVHCGSSLLGDLVYTVNYTDIATHWTIPLAQWNKGQQATSRSLARIQKTLPFPLLGLHPDTGSEFINWFVKDWADRERVELTRSRPYHKNDNAYVEQKNGHVVRRFVGYARMERRELVPLLNAFYETLTLYLNHFVPTRKCVEKIRIGSRYKRRYDTATTPYRRIVAHPDIATSVKETLHKVHQTLNPLILKQKLDTLHKRLFTAIKDYANHSSFR